MKITVLDGYGLNPGDLSWEEMAKLGELTVYDRTPADKTVERARDAAIVITNKTVLGAKEIEALPELRYIGVLATGYNVVDVKAAAERGIVVTNIPAYSTRSVAQLVFALLLAVTNRVEHYSAENRRVRWSANPDFCYWDFPLMELAGKTFGIVGFGNIGATVASIALAMGMKVLAFTSKPADALPAGVAKAESLDALFTEADVVSLHCPLTPETTAMVDARRLSLMKPMAILINTGRGPLVDEEALALALNEETIYAAALDVLSSEPPKADNPLLTARNCFITPHIGWATYEARVRLMDIATANLKGWLSGTPVNVVS